MLLLDSKTMEHDGVTVFPDHADPAQFYYMPLAPHLTIRKDDGGIAMPQFSLIRFKGEAGTGGFLNFDVNLGLESGRFNAVKSAVQQKAGIDQEIRLAPLPVIDGSIRLIMLDKDSGAVAPRPGEPAPPEAALRFVEKINHAAKPSLYGDNQAAFSIQLTEDGAKTILQSLEGEILPIAVVYSLEYLGLRPAYNVRLKIEWDRVQKHMDESFGANFLVFSTEIGKAVDDLVENKAIVFEADSFITDDAEAEGSVAGRRDAAIAQVRAMITDTFFQPSLPPWKPDDGGGWSKDLQKAADVMALIAGGPAAAATSKSMFSYKKMEYERTDRKSLNVNFSERVTVKRSIFPQGHLAGLFEPLRQAGIDRSRFITDVDLDDPWFKRRRLEVFAQTDFTSDQIGSINVRARYGGEPKNAILKKDVLSAKFDWGSQLDGNTMRMPVELEYEVNFDGVDATERPKVLKSALEIEEGEQKGIDPRNIYAISTVPMVAINFPWDRYNMVEVHVRYTDSANSLAQAEVFRLTEKEPEKQWPIFILDTKLRSFEYRFVYRGVDHIDHETPWQASDDEQIGVTDPFPRKRELSVVTALDWTVTSNCFVDVMYRDPDHGIDERRSLEFKEGDTSKSAIFELQDPRVQIVQYSGMILTRDGRTIEIPPSTTVGPRVVIRPDMKGRRHIEIRPPTDFVARGLVKVTAEMRFEDFNAGLSFKDNLLFEPTSGSKPFEYDYVDTARAQYERRITYAFDNGLQKVVEWQPGDDEIVQLRVP